MDKAFAFMGRNSIFGSCKVSFQNDQQDDGCEEFIKFPVLIDRPVNLLFSNLKQNAPTSQTPDMNPASSTTTLSLA
jgi:hypothetical protein